MTTRNRVLVLCAVATPITGLWVSAAMAINELAVITADERVVRAAAIEDSLEL